MPKMSLTQFSPKWGFSPTWVKPSRWVKPDNPDDIVQP